jgi:hypothetical protein
VPEQPPDDRPTTEPLKVLRKHRDGVYRGDGFTGPTRRYILVVAMLVGLASLPTLAAITAGSSELAQDKPPTSDVPFIPPAASGPILTTPLPYAHSTPPAIPTQATEPPLTSGDPPATPAQPPAATPPDSPAAPAPGSPGGAAPGSPGGAAPDSAGAAPGSPAAAPDSSPAAPDSHGAAPDSHGAVPDSHGAAPDSSEAEPGPTAESGPGAAAHPDRTPADVPPGPFISESAKAPKPSPSDTQDVPEPEGPPEPPEDPPNNPTDLLDPYITLTIEPTRDLEPADRP